MTVCLWFKRDLRLHDHAALARAAGRGPVLPLFIVEPAYWALPDTSGRQWEFVRESVSELAEAVAGRGARLVVRVGDAVEILEALRLRYGLTDLVSHEETGNGWTYARDLRVAAWARGQAVRWEELPQAGVVRRLKTRDGWAARRDRALAGPPVPFPESFAAVAAPSDPLPTAAELGLAPDPCPERQQGGRAAGQALLRSFLSERGAPYRKAMSSPLAGETACSRLSPHLALGTLSAGETVAASAARKAALPNPKSAWSGSIRSFEARLAWRDHFMQKLEDAPALEHRCLHSAYETLRPREADTTRLGAWAAGETGLPFVDACMRYLRATGWLNFRMRSMVVAVASYHLWLDWRATGPILARLFTDYEPGIHWSQMQMQSGTTGMNTVRIYNPVKQGHDQDPAGLFTRRWVPELADVPDRHLQAPWTWEQAGRVLGRSYPEPMVDVAAAAREAREKVWAVRRGEAFRTEAARVIAKHASRKDRQNRFVNDRAPRRRTAKRSDPGQLSLDL